MAVIKAYMVINVFLLPKSFVNGGWAVGIGMLGVACIVNGSAFYKLIQTAVVHKEYDYTELVRKAYGDKWAHIFKICIGITHFQFTFGQLSFSLKSLQSTITIWLGLKKDLPLWVFGLVIFFAYLPICWVRNLATLSPLF
jgi:amino acid permease